MKVTINSRGQLETPDGRIVGEAKMWDLPRTKGHYCLLCNEIIPVYLWDYHRTICKTIGAGRLSTGYLWKNFTPPLRKSRNGGVTTRDLIESLIELAR